MNRGGGGGVRWRSRVNGDGGTVNDRNPSPQTWWDYFFEKPKDPPTHLPWWRGGGHDDSVLRPPSYWAALEEKQKQQRPSWWRRRLQAEAAKRSYGVDNYKGTTWGVAVGAQADQNYPIGGCDVIIP